MDPERARSALKLIARGFDLLADAVGGDPSDLSEEDREIALASEWGSRGLDQKEASVLCQKHGFAGQKVGAWVRGDLVVMRDDGLRYLTPLALTRLAAGRSPATA